MVKYKLFFAKWHEDYLHRKYSEQSYYYRGAEGPTEWFKLNFIQRGSIASYLFFVYFIQYMTIIGLLILLVIIFLRWI